MSELRRLWEENAGAWIDAVREKRIESRRVVTDAAIVAAVLETRPRTVLDLGCGEGWLMRALASHGIPVTGVDASLPLAYAAHAIVAAYDALPFARGFDTIVANFSLLDERLPILPPHEHFVIQTLHPGTTAEDSWCTATLDGWTEPMPWYSRTMESWPQLLGKHYRKVERIEPRWPDRDEPASLILRATR